MYVTHDQTEAMTLGDRVAVMRAGELQQVGTPQELYNEPVNLFVAGFLGSPAIMFAISVLGVLIFAGLTAYDTQNIKTTYIQHAAHGDAEWIAKSGIMGALSLYLNFINMFMMLLQLFGNRE